MDDHAGITAEDLPDIYREGYLHAIKAARCEHDPAIEWESFREHLWTTLVKVFGVEQEAEPLEIDSTSTGLGRPRGSAP